MRHGNQSGAARPVTSDENLEEFITSLLTASRVLVGIAARSLSTVEQTVTVTQFRTLVILETNAPMKLNSLADCLGVNASTAMRMVDRLLVANLVTRRDNPGNRREVLIELSTSGRGVVRKVTAARRAEIARIAGAMSEHQRDRLISALRAFARAAEEPDVASGPTILGW